MTVGRSTSERHPTHADIDHRLERGEHRFKAIEEKIDALLDASVGMQADIAATKELVEAWGAVKTAGRFIKWLAGVMAALVALIVATKAGLAHIVTGVIR